MNTANLPLKLRSLYDAVLQKPPYGWFPSTPELTEIMLEQVVIEARMQALEPSAGSGELAEAMRNQGIEVDVIERDPRFQLLLFQQGFRLVGQDFLACQPIQQYDLILMNPPFSASIHQRSVDLLHIKRAYDEFLAANGQLVSVVSNSMKHTSCPRVQRFRSFLHRVQAELIELPLEIFWNSDRPVMVESRLVVIKKQVAIAPSTVMN
jgi:phospholipid N-methyltransferase